MRTFTITIDAQLTPEELTEILQKIRDIEQRQPKQVFVLWVEAPNLTAADGIAIMGNLRPPLPVTQTIFR